MFPPPNSISPTIKKSTTNWSCCFRFQFFPKSKPVSPLPAEGFRCSYNPASRDRNDRGIQGPCLCAPRAEEAFVRSTGPIIIDKSGQVHDSFRIAIESFLNGCYLKPFINLIINLPSAAVLFRVTVTGFYRNRCFYRFVKEPTRVKTILTASRLWAISLKTRTKWPK